VPRLDAVDLSDVAGTALRRAEQILSGHKVTVEIPPDLPLLRVDPVLFEQVLFNLLDNAAKYAPPGTSITVQAKKDGPTVHMEIADEGRGIPADDLERVFDKFYRAQAGDTRRAGTGLGLAICRGFLQVMNAAIFVKNRETRPGAVFVITLPIAARQPAGVAA
jgi:two-component system sensor histidine kinase KdpD